MLNRKGFLVLFFCSLFCLAGCSALKKPKPKIHHFTLEYTVPKIEDLKPIKAVLRVDRFGTAPAYNSNRMIYQDESFKRDEYIYSKWIANPGSFATYFLARDLRDSGLFTAVFTYKSHLAATYALEGSVDEFFEWDSPKGWNAVLGLSLMLVVLKEPDITKRILFQKSYRVIRPCKEEHPRGLAETMSLAMQEVSEIIIRDVYTVLKDQQ
jgi:cholesterol transport system auxiliary component